MPKDMIHVDHPDDERFDEVHIHIVERWKESEISGDEWRFNYVADVKRKGELLFSVATSRLEWLLAGLNWKIMTSPEEGNFDHTAYDKTRSKCDQPGCANDVVVRYRRLKRYTKWGEELAPSDYHDGNEYRQFCGKHKHRGDCGLDDADHNYERMAEV